MSFKLPGGGSVRIDETDISLPVSLRSATDGAGVTGLTNSSVTLSYWRQGAVDTPIDASPLDAVNSAHSDGAFIEVSSTSMPGTYRLDVPDAAFAQGADWVVIEVAAPTTAGAKMQFTLTEDGLVRAGTAQAGAAGTITLDANASTVTNAYVEDIIYVASGTGSEQARMIESYNTSTKVATVHKNWDVNPASDSIFLISASHGAIAPNTYSDVTVRVEPINYSGMTVAVDDIAPASLLSMSIDTGAARYIQDAFAAMRNKVELGSSTFTVYAGDDATAAWTGAVSRSQLSAIDAIDPG